MDADRFGAYLHGIDNYAAPCYKHKMNIYTFPQQKVLCGERPFSRELLLSLLEIVYSPSLPVTGYLKIAGAEAAIHFLFFFNGVPYSAGKLSNGKPASYSIREFGEHLALSADKALTVTLCETDPVLLKNMLLFLQVEPDVKAPASLIDIECIVRQIGEIGDDAMIALQRDDKINFFFFRNGKAALAHYSDMEFKPPDGMTVDEEMLLYAFQSEKTVQAFVFRNMATTMAEDSSPLDKASLYKLLTVVNPKNRRRDDDKKSPMSAENHNNRRREDSVLSPTQVTEKGKDLVEARSKKQKLPSVVLAVESGPLKGRRFTVTLPCIIGRSDCDLRLDDQRVSRRHANIIMFENILVIEDLASKNGTKVNGEAVSKKRLIPNDLISIGPINLRISLE